MMKKFAQHGRLCLVSGGTAFALAILAQSSVVRAQTAASAAVTEPALEEVVVTAERRAVDLQKTPITVAAVSQADMTNLGIVDAYTLNKLVPDLNITPSAAGFSIHLRGVFSGDSSPTSEAPVALAMDGAPLVKNLALNGLQYDLQRVEVLKGPQGTLYGRNSTGGVVNYITNRPAFSDSATGEIEYGNYNLLRTFGMFNTQINDQLAVRAAYQSLYHSGYMDSGLQDADQKSGRLEALWKPSDKDSLLLVGDFTNIGGKGAVGGVPIGRVLSAQGGSDESLAIPIPSSPFNDRGFDGNAAPYHLNSNSNGIMGEYNHEFSAAALTVQAADRWFNSYPTSSSGGTNYNFSSIPGFRTPPYYNPNIPGAGVTDFFSRFHSDTFEARLASTGNDSLQWTLGVDGLRDADRGILGNWPTWVMGSPAPGSPGNQTLFLGLAEIAKSEAAFGQITWSPYERLHLTAGLRYNGDQKTGATSTLAGSGLTPPGVLAPYTKWAKSWTGVTNRLAVNFDLTDNVMIYVSEAKGYKPGGIAYGPTPVYNPETNLALEAGIKSRFLDNRVQVNLSVYHYDYKNVEVADAYRIYPAAGAPVQVISVTNAGGEKMYGYDLDAQFLATADDRITLNLAGEHAEYGSFLVPEPPYSPLPTPPAGFTNTPPQDLSNTPLPLVPKWSGNLGYDHTFHMGDGQLDLSLFSQFRGRMLMTDFYTNYPTALIPNLKAYYLYDTPHATFDASLKYSSANDKWMATAYVRNFTNKVYYQNEAASNTTGLITGVPFPPRTLGVILTRHF